MRQKILFLPILLFIFLSANAQSTLSVDYIMRDPAWMGTFPSSVQWSEDSKQIYFEYNKEKDPTDSLYRINLSDLNSISKVNWPEEKALRNISTNFNTDKSYRLIKQKNKLLLEDVKSGKSDVILDWFDDFSNPTFLADQGKVAFNFSNNIYVVEIKSKAIKKLTNISSETAPAKKPKTDTKTEELNFVKEENLSLLQVISKREKTAQDSKAYREAIKENEDEKFTYYTSGKTPSSLQISPDTRYATFAHYKTETNQSTKVPDYVAASGYTKDLNARPKVGTKPTTSEIGIYDLQRDTVYFVSVADLTGIKDFPDYIVDYPDTTRQEKEREVALSGPFFSPDGKSAIIQVKSYDNKDRWITKLDLETGSLSVLDRQRDEAWIGGPGIGWTFSPGTFGWLPDNRHIYFQSEETGYSHLYILDVNSGEKKALTSGEFEVFDPFISKDKKHWYLTTSEVDPGERHFYKMLLMGGEMEKLTNMIGNNEVALSPDEKQLAILYSYSNKPTELYLQDNKSGAKAVQLTNGQSKEFKSYNWRAPSIVRFAAEDGAKVPARLYSPDADKKNGAAVIFVHGAGYLQNAHKWWSTYFREYMFHNLLTDLGYTVLDIDYRASAGYGRDWRTGIYRHMGGKDLSDQVDGAKFLVELQGVDANRIGIYGGSYGGFITLMALFTEPDVFKSGAALRSVTDWSHYNHGYTANILNTPEEDPIAYRRSSPIYFAEGLKGNLLMAHGMVDVNVHFQDVVRLSQRLIELGKDNWEMAIYPVEDHGFVEPSSWADEYKRILKLFNNTLLED